MKNAQIAVKFRLVTANDIAGIIQLQKHSFPKMAIRGEIWEKEELQKYLRVFPEGQFCAEINGKIIGSASSLIVNLVPEHKTHTWYDICYDNLDGSHTLDGDTLYDVDISVLPEYHNLGIASKLYSIRKELAIKMGLKRIIGGGRLSNFYKYCDLMDAEHYLKKVVDKTIQEPAIWCQLKNGFNIVKLLPNYLPDDDSLNYAAFIEWKNNQQHGANF